MRKRGGSGILVMCEETWSMACYALAHEPATEAVKVLRLAIKPVFYGRVPRSTAVETTRETQASRSDIEICIPKYTCSEKQRVIHNE